MRKCTVAATERRDMVPEKQDNHEDMQNECRPEAIKQQREENDNKEVPNDGDGDERR